MPTTEIKVPITTAFCQYHEMLEIVVKIKNTERINKTLDAYAVHGKVACGGNVNFVARAYQIEEWMRRNNAGGYSGRGR